MPTSFVDLSEQEQISVVLITLLDDVREGRRENGTVSNVIIDLFNALSSTLVLDVTEVALVTDTVAKYGIERLPARITA